MIHSLDLKEPKNYIENLLTVGITLHKTKALSRKPRSLQEPKNYIENLLTVGITLHKTKALSRNPRSLPNSPTNYGFSPPNCTTLLDSPVQAQKRFRSN